VSGKPDIRLFAQSRTFEDQSRRDPKGTISAQRVLLLSEFFPRRPETQVSGLFRRLRFHIEALTMFGALDLAFFWPAAEPIVGIPNEGEEAFRAAWGVKGRIWFIPTGRIRGGSARGALSDMLWAWRGAIGFFHERPTLRTCRWPQVHCLDQILSSGAYDLVFAHRMGSAAAAVRLGARSPPIVIDFDDLEHIRFLQAAPAERSLPAWAGRKWAAALARRAERLAASKAACSFVCSEADRRRLSLLAPGANIAVVVNSADPNVELSNSVDPIIIFVGTARYGPNREGILWFVTTIWPMIRKANPPARLIVVGQDSEQIGVEDGKSGIAVTGFQSDLAALYQQAAIAVCPVLSGTGTRIKIIEAAMHGLPVVSTAIGAEGLTFEDGLDIVIADDPTDFAKACAGLLADARRRREIGQAARVRARRDYAPLAARDVMLKACAEACGVR
jgi:glycosyltransferase involved in cell wall biosynthesis